MNNGVDGENFDNPIYNSSDDLLRNANNGVGGENLHSSSTSNGVASIPTESAYETLSRVKGQALGDSYSENTTPVGGYKSSDVNGQSVGDEYETPTHGGDQATHI